jgi:hypothetical protein
MLRSLSPRHEDRVEITTGHEEPEGLSDVPLAIRTLLEFEKFGKPKDIRAINEGIIRCLTGKRKAPKNPRIGYIYAFGSPESAPKHMKIGKTRLLTEERTEQWRKCKLHVSEIHMDKSHRNPFPHFHIVESLIMAELHNERRRYKCGVCHQTHQEWYEIEPKQALPKIIRWRTWILTQDPFDENSNLRPYWQWKVDRLRHGLDMIDWDAWTQPKKWHFSQEYIEYSVETFWKGYSMKALIGTDRKDKRFVINGVFFLLLLQIWRGTVHSIIFAIVLLAL